MTPGFFSGLVMMFLMRKKRVPPRSYEGMVSISSVKQHPVTHEDQISEIDVLVRLGLEDFWIG